MRYVWALDGYVYVGGRRLPVVLALLIVATLVLSIAGAVQFENGFRLGRWGVLLPEAVWQGQVWRLLSWVFFETDALNLIFACLMLFSFGEGLADSWGPRRFLAVYLGMAAASASLTCLFGLAWPPLMLARYSGGAAVSAALIVAWAVLFPHRQMAVWFVLLITGRNLLFLIVGATLVLGFLNGLTPVLPALLAEGLMLFYVREPTVYGLWLRLRLAGFRWKPKKAAHLRVVEREEPPRWLH